MLLKRLRRSFGSRISLLHKILLLIRQIDIMKEWSICLGRACQSLWLLQLLLSFVLRNRRERELIIVDGSSLCMKGLLAWRLPVTEQSSIVLLDILRPILADLAS